MNAAGILDLVSGPATGRTADTPVSDTAKPLPNLDPGDRVEISALATEAGEVLRNIKAAREEVANLAKAFKAQQREVAEEVLGFVDRLLEGTLQGVLELSLLGNNADLAKRASSLVHIAEGAISTISKSFDDVDALTQVEPLQALNRSFANIARNARLIAGIVEATARDAGQLSQAFDARRDIEGSIRSIARDLSAPVNIFA